MHVFKKPVMIFSSQLHIVIIWNMENFQFPLLTYCLEAQIFLREVTPGVLTIVPRCGSL